MKKFLSIIFLISVLFGRSQDLITSVPFELYGNHIFTKVSVDDSKPLDFIFDSGDGLTVIDLDIANELNLVIDQKQTVKGAGGEVRGALIKHNKIEVKGLLMESDVKVYTTSLNHLEISIGRNVDGIVGYDLLQNHDIVINHDDNIIQIYKKGKAPAIGEKLSFKLQNAIPVVESVVKLNNGEELKCDFYLNTGAGTTMDFNTPFANSNKIIDKTGEHYSYLVKGLEEQETKHFEGRVTSFTFGSDTFEDFPIGISQANYGLQNDKKISGIIGNRLLKKYNITFSYSKGAIYLQKNKMFDETLNVNSSGMDVQLSTDKQKILIHQVYDNSPAKNAGIMENDVLVQINGKSAVELGIPAVKKLLQNTGEKVELVISQRGEEKTINIQLKELI